MAVTAELDFASLHLPNKDRLMLVAKNRVVLFDYTLTDNDGQTIDSSDGGEPLAYLHGSGNIIPGLEAAMLGRRAGESFTVNIAPEDGYGPRYPEMQQAVPSHLFEGVEEFEVGMQFHAEDGNGTPRLVTVVAVEGDAITVDGNHPLAGVELNFDVTIIDVRDASAEELEHGHVHGAGGHHH